MRHLTCVGAIAVLLAFACNDETIPAVPEAGLPPGSLPDGIFPPPPGTGGASGMGGAGGAGGVGGSLGACNSPTDIEILRTVNVRTNADFCSGVSCFNTIASPPLYAQCVTECLEQRVAGLSFECAECYGDELSCGLRNFCFNSCQFAACSVPCRTCLEFASCTSAFEVCRGLPGNGCRDTELP